MQIILLLYIFLAHDNTNSVFLYISIFAEYEKESINKNVEEMSLKETKKSSSFIQQYIYTHNQNKIKGPWQRTGILLDYASRSGFQKKILWAIIFIHTTFDMHYVHICNQQFMHSVCILFFCMWQCTSIELTVWKETISIPPFQEEGILMYWNTYACWTLGGESDNITRIRMCQLQRLYGDTEAFLCSLTQIQTL